MRVGGVVSWAKIWGRGRGVGCGMEESMGVRIGAGGCIASVAIVVDVSGFVVLWFVDSVVVLRKDPKRGVGKFWRGRFRETASHFTLLAYDSQRGSRSSLTTDLLPFFYTILSSHSSITNTCSYSFTQKS